MTISKRNKIIGLIAFLVILIGNLTIISYVILNKEPPSASMEQIVALYNAGNFKEAQPLLEQLIMRDPANEKAYVYLARIAQKNNNPSTESFYWSIASKLNPLEKSYQDNALTAWGQCRDYKTILEQLAPGGQTVKKALEPNQAFLYVLALLRTGKDSAASIYLEMLKRKMPDFFTSTKGKFLKTLEKHPPQIDDLKPFAQSKDTVIATEATITLTELQTRQGQFKDVENTLKRLRTVNPFCGNPRLAGFHMQFCQFPQAIEVLKEDFKHYNRLSSAILLAEAWFMTADTENLKSLQADFNLDGQDAITAGKYIDTLVALTEKDDSRAFREWENLKTSINTQLSNLIGLYISAKQENTTEVEQRWLALLATPPFRDFPQRAKSIVYGYIKTLIAKERFDEAAKLLSMPTINPMHELIFARCFIAHKMDQRSLTQKDLTNAIEHFPRDLFILQIAAEFYFTRQETEKSTLFVNAALKLNPPPNSGVYYLRIHNLIRTAKFQEAAQRYLELIEKLPDNRNLIVEFCMFCHDQKMAEPLKNLSDMLSKEASRRSLILPFVEGYRLLCLGKTEQALEQFKNVVSGNPLIIFRTAYVLGSHDQIKDALAMYQKLREKHPKFNAIHTLLNMAELYDALGDLPKALRLAQKAWESAPKEVSTLSVYGDKLLKANQAARVLEIIPQSRLKGNAQLLAIWSQAVERRIPVILKDGQKAIARKLAQDYEFWNPNSDTARKLMTMTNPKKKAND